MDPISQAAVGVVAAQAGSSKSKLAQAAVIGGLAAMAPDLDVVIRSSDDPLLALEYHRHFTHSLAFIPVGAFLCALFSKLLFQRHWQLSFKTIYLWSLLGYASHGLLDACTTYGTYLLWPFSDVRVAWNTISVVDPLFTLPLLFCVVLAASRKSKLALSIGILWAASYLAFGVVQNYRAELVAEQLVADRKHNASAISVKPSFANLMVWKLVYEHDGYFYVDAIRAGFGDSTIWKGGRIEKLDVERHFEWLDSASQQAKDIERFRHFSSGYIGIDPTLENHVVDIRYSLIPQEIEPLWGIELDESKEMTQHVTYFTNRGDAWDAIKKLYQMTVDP